MNRLIELLITVLIITPLSGGLVAQDRVDSLTKVVYHLFKNYDVPHPVSSNVEFLKRKDGYYIRVFDLLTDESPEEKFYDSDKNEFLAIGLFTRMNSAQKASWIYDPSGMLYEYSPKKQVEEFKNLNSVLFDDARIYPYYGYKGFYNDVIHFYESKPVLNTDELYVLGTAYSRKLTSGLLEQPEASDSDKFGLLKNQGAFDANNLEKYLDVYKRRNAIFHELMVRDSGFVTIKGDAKLFYGHMVMDGVVQLLFRKGATAAKKIVEQENLYDNNTLEDAKNMLNSCPPASVLFTFEEKDTYPLYFLQLKDDFRSDVIIVNLSLAIMPEYMRFIYEGPLKALTLGHPKYLTNYDSRIVFNSSRNNLANTEAATFLNDIEEALINHKSEPDYTLRPVKATNILVYFTADCESGEEKKCLIKLPYYFYVDLVLIIDLLDHRCPKRPVCFSDRIPAETLAPFSKFLEKRGSIYLIN